MNTTTKSLLDAVNFNESVTEKSLYTFLSDEMQFEKIKLQTHQALGNLKESIRCDTKILRLESRLSLLRLSRLRDRC